MITEQLGIPAPGSYPSPRLLRTWKSMPPWQAKRERAKWWREHGQQDGQAAPSQAPVPVPSAPEGRARTRRRLTTEELERRVKRRAELDDPAFSGTVGPEDLAIASPATITRLMNAGVLERDLGGPPPQRQPGARR